MNNFINEEKKVNYTILKFEKGDLYIPDGANKDTPKVLTIHGGGWRHLDRYSFCGVSESLVERGAIVYNTSYRLTTVVPWPACGDDCLEAAKFLSEYRTDIYTDKIFTVGGSAGGHLSLMTGLRFDKSKVLGVVSISGISHPDVDMRENPDRYELLLKGLDDKAKQEAFPTACLNGDLPDILLTHNFDDTVVSIESSKKFESMLRDKNYHVETYYYDEGRENEGHAIWIKDSNPHKLYGDIERRIWRFISERYGEKAFKKIGRVKAKSSKDISSGEYKVSVGFEGLDRHLFDPEFCYEKLSETGVKYARIQSGWSICEKVKGVYDFTELDDVVNNLVKNGIEPWIMVGFGNELWMGKCYTSAAVGCVPLYYGEECKEAWIRYVDALSKRYATVVKHWEIWNEPDLHHFWQPKAPDVEMYLQLIKLTGSIIRENVSDAKIGGCCSTVLNQYVVDATKICAKDVDFWSFHAYNVIPEMAKGEQRDPNGKLLDFVSQIALIKKMFAEGGNPNVEIWQSEAGFPSWFPKSHWLLGDNKEGFGCEEWQGKWLLRRFLTDRRAGCSLTSFYACADICRAYAMATTTQLHPAEHGLLNSRFDYSRKASHKTFSMYNAVFADAKFLSSVKKDDVIIDKYEKSGKVFYAYYLPLDLRKNSESKFIDINKIGDVEEAVWIDMLIGVAYESTSLLPLRDYPIVLIPRNLVDVM